MRIALTKGTLQIPPTYFAVQHALALRGEHDFEFFSLISDVRDPVIAEQLTFHEAVGLRNAPARVREALIPLSFRRMASEVAAFRPDVVHQHFANWPQPALRAAERAGAPLIVTAHGSDVGVAEAAHRGTRVRYHGAAIRDALARADQVLAVSRFLASRVERFVSDPGRVRVHYQGVDTDYFTPGRSESAQRPVVLFVGSITPLKGVVDLVDASIEIQASRDHELRLIGPVGASTSLVSAAAAEHDHISYLGALSRSHVRDELRRAHVLVLPTKSEAAGLVLLEAQACGTPVIAYATGGTPEMMTPNETGLLVHERNVSALAASIADMLDLSGTAYDAMARRARDFVVKDRSLTGSARELDGIYRGLGSA